jgi:HEAT repeat protein
MGKIDKIDKLVAKRKSDKIVAMIHDKDAEVREAAIGALGKIGDENSMNTLVTLLRDPIAGNRAATVKALGLLAVRDTRNTAAKSHLQYLKTSEKDPLVIQALEETMTKISKA